MIIYVAKRHLQRKYKLKQPTFTVNKANKIEI